MQFPARRPTAPSVILFPGCIPNCMERIWGSWPRRACRPGTGSAPSAADRTYPDGIPKSDQFRGLPRVVRRTPCHQACRSPHAELTSAKRWHYGCSARVRFPAAQEQPASAAQQGICTEVNSRYKDCSPATSPIESLAVREVPGEIGGSSPSLAAGGKSGDQMYVGGLGAAAGGPPSFVGQAPAVDAPPRQAPYERDQIASRAASGAARGLLSPPAGGGGGRPSARRRRPAGRAA